MLIPQSMAYAELAGLPAHVGLFAAALPPLLAAPFVSSPFLQTGPVALTALLTFGALEVRAEPFSGEYLKLAALLAVLVGFVRMLLGFVRLGNVAYLLSSPVLIGFTTGAATLIVSSQFPNAVGYEGERNGIISTAFDTLTSPGDWHLPTVAFAVLTAIVMVVGRRAHPLFPGVLVAVIVATIVSAATDYGGAVTGELPGGFIEPSLDLPWASAPGMIVSAFAIAMVGFAEGSSIARRFAAEERQRWNANQEMFGQGVANFASGISGGFPVGGSFSRSALNKLAGARTRWAGAVTGLTVLLALPFTPLLESLPRAVLGAIVITSVISLIDVRRLWKLIGESWPQAVVGFGTLAATLGFAPRVERGVLVGIGLAVAVHLFRELSVNVQYEIDDRQLVVHPQGVLWFATVPAIERIIRVELADHPEIRSVLFDMSGIGRLDYTGAATFEQVMSTLLETGIAVELSNVPPGAQRAARIHLNEHMD